MSARRFKFVSPGVFINEIDNSQLPAEDAAVGPAVIGPLARGPANRPVTVSSFSEFVEIFGNPIGGGLGGDVWREGNTLAPTYAAFAAQAYLRNSAPVTVVRTLGEPHPDATTAGAAGWACANAHASTATPASNGGAFGLFLFSSGSAQQDHVGAFLGAPNGSTGAGQGPVTRNAASTTGSLAAVWYFDEGAIELSGNLHSGVRASVGQGEGEFSPTEVAMAGNAVALKTSAASTMEFTAVLFDASNVGKKVVFNFDRNSDKYIRKVFNTNPTLAGAAATVNSSGARQYWLGETFDRHAKDLHGSGDLHQGNLAADSSLYGVILGLRSSNGERDWASNQMGMQNSKTGWFFSQDLTTNTTKFDAGKMQKLFRFEALNDGVWSSKNLKISVSELKAATDSNPYGTFTVTLRSVRDSDAAIRTVEKFGNCNLNPNSSDYIGAKIGDMYQEWDTSENRYRVYGSHPNQSRFIRVVINEEVDQGLTDPAYLPFGFYGPVRYGRQIFHPKDNFSTGFTNPLAATEIITGSTVHMSGNSVEATIYAGGRVYMTGALMQEFSTADANSPIQPAGIFNSIFSASADSVMFVNGYGGPSTAAGGAAAEDGNSPVRPSGSILFPSLPLRVSSSDEGLPDDKRAHFGISTYRTPGSTRFEESYLDIVAGGKGLGHSNNHISTITGTEYSFIFTLDDLNSAETGSVAPASVTGMYYASGSRQHATSYTARRAGYTDLIDAGFTSFTAPFVGGYDGVDIKERSPFGQHIINDKTFKTSYAAHSLKRCVDSIADPEVVEINMMCMPGVREPLVTDHILSTCEDRADALAIIDIENGGYQPATETTDSFKTRISNNSVTTAITKIKQRGINNSYGCAYFPWVKIYDEINDKQVWVPPSVVALGTFASTERHSELWFAPAGFTRGGLSEGSAGLPVLNVSQRLTSKDRDKLYEQNVNPIATFPAEGIVIFGQKTLQSTRSALDRINVRRLMIFVKKEISRIASRLLFDQNVQSTWNRFRGQVEPFLDSVKARLGLSAFKVVLDETTTTPDLVDRNIMYAKIFLKPARAIEFIAIDFVITNTGASFED